MAQPIVGRVNANAAVARFAPAPGGAAPPAPARAPLLALRARQAPPAGPGHLLPLPLRAHQAPAPPPAPPGPPPILPPIVLPPVPNRVLDAAGGVQHAAARAPAIPLQQAQHLVGAPPPAQAAAVQQPAQAQVGGHQAPAAAIPAALGPQQAAQVVLQPQGDLAPVAQAVGAGMGGQNQQLLLAQADHPAAAANACQNAAVAPVDPSVLALAPSALVSTPAGSSSKRRRSSNAVNPDRIRSAVDDLRHHGLNDQLADSLLAAMQGDSFVGPTSVSSASAPLTSSSRGFPLHRSSVPLILKRLNFDASALGAFLEVTESKQSDACAFLTGKAFTLEKCEAYIEGHDPSDEFPITKFADIVSVVARRGIHTACATLMLGDHPWSHLSMFGKMTVFAVKTSIALEIIVALCEDPDADSASLKKAVSSMWAAGFDLLASPGEKAKFILQRQQQLAERLAKLASRSTSSSSVAPATAPVAMASSAPSASRRSTRSRNSEFCFRWNNNFRSCPDPCPYRRLHICWGCRGPHPLSHCPTKDLAPPMAKPGASQSPPVSSASQAPTGSPFHLPASQVYGQGQQSSAMGIGGNFGGYGGQPAHNVAAQPPMNAFNLAPNSQSARQSSVGYGNHPVTGQPVFNPSFAGYGPPPGSNSKKNAFPKGK